MLTVSAGVVASLSGHLMVFVGWLEMQKRFSVPPTLSHGPLPHEVATKCHSAGIPKSAL